MPLEIKQRRELARELSRIADASVEQVLSEPPGTVPPARRIGITGPPGVGKSTLVGAFAKARAAQGREVGVLAIDPASPYTQGAILGDRIRVAEATEDQRIFMRSLSSRDANDGMCNNTADLLRAVERRGFDDVLLETVGVGQAEHAVRTLVDTVVLLLQPETGDAIQALKAGILEIADIIVISKCDLQGAKAMRENVAATTKFRTKTADDWQVPVVLVSVESGIGLDTLSESIDAHAVWRESHVDRNEIDAARQAYRLRDLLLRQVDGMVAEATKAAGDDIRAAYRWVVERL